MNTFEDILVDVLVSTGDQDSALNLGLVSLALLFLLRSVAVTIHTRELVARVVRHVFIHVVLLALVVLLIFLAGHFRLFLLLVVGDIKSLDDNFLQASVTGVLAVFATFLSIFSVLRVFQFTVFVSDNLNELGFTDDGDALVFEHDFDLILNFRVIEGIGVDDRDVLLNGGIFRFVDVAVDPGDAEDDVVSTHSAADETLNESVGVERASVHDDLSAAAFVGKSFHKRAVLGQVAVEVGIVNGEDTLSTFHANNALTLVDTVRGVVERVKGFVLDSHSQNKVIIGDNVSVI